MLLAGGINRVVDLVCDEGCVPTYTRLMSPV